MTNLKEKIKKLSKTAKAGLVGLSLATLVGTFGGNEGGFAPFYNKKSGTWGGINIGIYNQFQENSKFYGLSIGFIQLPAKDKDSPFVKNNFYGMKIGVGNGSGNLNGVQKGGLNFSENLNGAQIGVINASENLNGVQIGAVNENQKGWSILLGFGKGEK